MANSDIEYIKNQEYSTHSENFFSPKSTLSYPNGAVSVKKNEYATSTYVFIPNKKINDILAGYSNNILSFAASYLSNYLGNYSWIGYLLDLIQSINVSKLEYFRDNGYSVIKMSYIDHTEGDRGSGGYVKWNNPYYIDSNIFPNLRAL